MSFEVWILLVIGLLQVGDAWSTRWIIKRGGRETNEGLNELARFLTAYTNAKWAWLLIAKVLVMAACLFVVESGGAVWLLPLLPWYVLVVAHNDMERRGQVGFLRREFWR